MREKNLSKKLFTSLTLILIISFSFNFTNIVVQENDEDNISLDHEDVPNKISSSGYWPVPFIYVFDNWSLTNQTYAWCNGSGTYSDPYIIENVTTTSNGAGGHCIVIHNTDEYFIIRNCTTSTTTNIITRYGILLINARNGTLIDNQVINNAGSGIGLSPSGCNNNTIINNNVSGNAFRGVYISSSSNNTIVQNNITNNGYDGIYLDESNNINKL